jgi:hypothetical protein
VQSLCEWLQIATDGLSTLAKERIWLEIEAHFTEGVEGHQTAGCTEDEARFAALAELGDAHAAAKRFRRRHLTENEAKRAEQIRKNSGRPTWLVGWYLADASVWFLYLPILTRYHVPLVFPAVVVVICAALQTINFFEARRKRPKPDIRQLVSIEILLNACFMLFFVWLGIWGNWGPCLVVSIPIFRWLVPDFLLWSKLGHVDRVWPETPSRA